MTRRAISRQSAAQQIMFYSITSSAAASFGLGPHDFGTYSLRRTKTTLIYRRTRNLRAMQLLLRQEKIEGAVCLQAQRWQDVRSFSSIEKIAPVSILTPRTTQTRPVTSVNFTS